jgi:hypothetical protein
VSFSILSSTSFFEISRENDSCSCIPNTKTTRCHLSV